MRKNAIVITNGCPENRLDCAETEQCLNHHGWMTTKKINQADLIVLNLCGLLNESEAESLNLIKQAKEKKRADAKILVTGCLPKINNPVLKDVFSGDIINGHNIEEILKILNEKKLSNNNSCNYLIPNHSFSESTINSIHRKIKHCVSFHALLNRSALIKYRKYSKQYDIVQPNTFYIKVSSGCVHKCSYCAVRISRGVVKSKPAEQIKQEFLNGLKAGYKHFALIGTDLGSYGKDIETDLPSLLNQLVSIRGQFDIKLRNVHPQLLISQLHEMVNIVKTGKIGQITTAVQHGNDRILKLMKRHYKIKKCMTAINALKQNCSNLIIRSQLIVGFPGETKKEFYDTIRLIGNIDVDFFEIYSYSLRLGTSAAKMKHQNTLKIIRKRKYIAIKRLLTFLKQKHSYNEPSIPEMSPIQVCAIKHVRQYFNRT